ncbi:MAG: hypothetical protein HY717_14835 [Planctomycetes bacterium]|nr:hypothetical protein [Planctomycetota bacterium]
MREFLKAPLQRPSFQLLLAFLALIGAGAALLLFPGSFARPEKVNFLAALFTSTSAVCVTGLTVVDTGADCTFRGQVIILVLIQLGGLGILTFSNWILLTVGRRQLGLSGRRLLEETHGQLGATEPGQLLKQIVFFTLFWEALGAAILFWRFRADLPASQALWFAIFHAVSAFCNAGFSLFSDSLARYQQDAAVNLTIMGLIVAGGLGFVVFSDLWRRLLGGVRRGLTLHTRVVLLTTTALILFGAGSFAVFEWSNAMTGFPLSKRFWPALFLSVTARTAGFNTVEVGRLTNASLFLLILLMIIGASPGSTGGGIKTTTAALFLAMFRSRLNNRSQVEIFRRSLPRDLVNKGLILTMVFLFVIFQATLILEWLEGTAIPVGRGRGRFLEHLFEVASASGTVGLSTGITSSLTAGSKIVIILCMFIGRLGPLLIADSFIGYRKEEPFSYPEERFLVG